VNAGAGQSAATARKSEGARLDIDRHRTERVGNDQRLRTAVDGLKDRLKAAIIVLASTSADGKVTLVAGVTAAETSRLQAGELVGHVAAQVGGRGGGRADFAQAGGTDASRLPEALASVVPYVRGKWGL
jgi:alanyl-tRNA synthetase